jgi:hypothetical protein
MILVLLLPGDFFGQQVFTRVQFDSIYENALSNIPSDLNKAIHILNRAFDSLPEEKVSFIKN